MGAEDFMKKFKTLLSGDTVRLTVAALIVFCAVYCVFPSAGLLATLPILPLCGLLIPFFYDEARLLAPIAALSAVLLTVALTDGYDALVFYSIVPSALFIGAFLTSRLLRHLKKGQKKTPAILGLVSAAALLILFHVLFSNPVSLLQTTEERVTLYNEHYADEEHSFSADGAHYDPLKRLHVATYRFHEVTFVAHEQEDGYLTTMKNRLAGEQKRLLIDLLHERFTDGNYRVSVTVCQGEAFGESFSFEELPEHWLWENEITLEFDSAMAVDTPDARAAFARRVREYKSHLDEIGFPYASMTLRAGEYETMVYELSFTPDTPLEKLVAPAVTDLRR